MTIAAPDKTQLPALRGLWQEAFCDTNEFLDSFFSVAFSPERCRIVLIEGQVGAALYWFDCNWDGKKLAYLYAIATAKQFRGQGLCHQLLKDAHCHFKQSGYTGSLLVPASKALFRFYETMGYQTFCHCREHTLNLCNGSVSCKAVAPWTGSFSAPMPISVTEYARLRQLYLPKGSILQEGSSLDFLEAQASFYKGGNYLFAARKEGMHLHGIELLGTLPTCFFPALISTLGCTTGTIRTPGTPQDSPFAMYRPMQTGTSAPSYFAFAFD